LATSSKKKFTVPAHDPSPVNDDNSVQVVNTADQSTDGLLCQWNEGWQFLWPIRRLWWDRERLLISHLADSYSMKSTRSHVTDGHLATLAFERQARVAAQLPTGSIYSLSSDKKAEESAQLMNMVLNKYILPGANSQFDALTKLRMSGVYASVYGAQPLFYDYRIDDEYIGPDFWLIPPRNFIPQPYKNSIRDCDWVMISTTVSVSYLESILERKNTSWNKANIKQLIQEAKKGKVPERDLDSTRRSEVENIRVFSWPQADQGSAARLELITKYEKGKNGKWITFAKDYKDIGALRSIMNPHKSGRIPVVMRQCFPLVDSIWGLGDFERGITLQKAKDSLINLYLDGVKLSIFPPLKIDATVVTASTIKLQAGARWLMKDLNAVQQFDTNPQSLQTFQGTYQFLTSALLTQFGTTDTQVNKEDTGNPAFGKTPAAINMLQDKEGARDNWDRYQLEMAIEDLWGGMINLLAENQEKPINFNIFKSDVEQILKQFGEQDDDDPKKIKPPKYMTMLGTQKAARITLPKSLISGQYKYIIDASSTLKAKDEDENQTWVELLQFYFSNPQIIDQYLQTDGLKFNAGEAIKQTVYSSSISDPDTIITEIGDDQPGQQGQMQLPQYDGEAMAQQVQDPEMANAVRAMFNRPAQAQPMQPQQPQMQLPQGGMNGQPSASPQL
jgi:hypothetical protein